MRLITLTLLLVLLAPIAVLGQNWTNTNGPSGNGVRKMVLDSKTNVFLISDVCIRSTDHGATWTQVQVPGDGATIADLSLTPDGSIIAIVGYSHYFYGTDSCSILKSTDDGTTWTRLFSATQLYGLATSTDSTIYVGAYTTNSPQAFYTYVSRDHGFTWDSSFVCLQQPLFAVAVDSNGVGIVATNGGVYRSTNQGRSWGKCVNGIGNSSFRTANCARGGTVFVSSYASTDDGRTWTGHAGAGVVAFSRSGRMLSDNGILQYSDDSGRTWHNFSLSSVNYTAVCGAPDDDGGFYCAAGNQVFRTIGQDLRGSSAFSIPVAHVLSVAATPDGTLLGSSVGYDYQRYQGQSIPATIWRSTDRGTSWSLVHDTLIVHDSTIVFDTVTHRDSIIHFDSVLDFGATQLNPRCFAIDSSHNILCGTAGNSISHSTDNGLSWSQISGSISVSLNTLIVAPNKNIFAGCSTDGVFRSSDGGATWDQLNYGITTRNVYSLAISQANDLFAGSDSAVYKSMDNGLSWSKLTLHPAPSRATAIVVSLQGNVIAAMSGNGMYQSTDGGTTWSNLGSGLPTKVINCLLVTPSGIVFAGTDSGVFQLPVNGTTWQPYNLGLTTKNVLSLTRNLSGQLFAGTDGCGVFSSVQTFNKIENSVRQMPSSEGLSITSTYPNPSSGKFSLRFSNRDAMNIRVECLDVMGSMVSLIPQSMYTAGEHELSIDFSSQASGCYAVRLVGSNGSVTVPVVVQK